MTGGAAASPVKLPWTAMLGAAGIVTLSRPVLWVFGLAGFLAAGGVIVVAWPILVLPTPTGLQNALGVPVSTLVLGGPTPALLALVTGVVLAVVLAILAGIWASAWAERQGIEIVLEAATGERIALPGSSLDGAIGSSLDGAIGSSLDGAPGSGRVAVIRLLGLLPILVALVLAWQPVYDAAYHQLILPDELVTPLPVRVIRDVPGPIVGVLITWFLAEAAAAVGVRHLLLERRGVPQAWLLGWLDLARRPLRVLGTALVGLGVLVMELAPLLMASSIGWARIREVVVEREEPLLAFASLMVWVAVWLGGLVLAGVAAAFRSAAWTLELPRPARDAPRDTR